MVPPRNPVTPEHLRDIEATLPALATLLEARQVLRLGDSSIRQAIKRRELIAIRRAPTGSSKLLVPRSEIIRYLTEREVAA